MHPPALLLLPNLLGDLPNHSPFLPISVDQAVSTLDGLIAESVKGGRRFLSRFTLKKAVHLTPLALLNEHTPDNDLNFLLEPILKGERWGLVSDAGLPCIADPGAKLVQRARSLGISVEAFIGPSSLLLALMLSGFSGQQFTFHGYLNRNPPLRQKQIKHLEEETQRIGATQIFIETPYRNLSLLEGLLSTLSPRTRLCIAWDLTLPSQTVLSQTIALWHKQPPPDIDKKAAIFLIGSF